MVLGTRNLQYMLGTWTPPPRLLAAIASRLKKGSGKSGWAAVADLGVPEVLWEQLASQPVIGRGCLQDKSTLKRFLVHIPIVGIMITV